MKQGKVKSRLVVDAKQSKVSAATKKFERTTLPRGLDAIFDALDVSAVAEREGRSMEDLEYFIADYRDAFMIVPNNPRERRWFVIFFRGRYYVFLVTVQGSRIAPLTFARVIALVTRLTQGTVGTRTCRLNCYVDDPLMAICAPAAERDLAIGMVLLIWSALGLPLSLNKAKRGTDMTWTSIRLGPSPRGVHVSVKEEIVEDAAGMTLAFLTRNLITKKELRQYVGKLTHIASFIIVMRPFITDLNGALYSVHGKAPQGCVFQKQIVHVLAWMKDFFCGTAGTLERTYELDAYLGRGAKIVLELDASPWGLGGVLVEDGIVQTWFASPISTEELQILGLTLGDCAAQQAMEALALLVALRAWHARWRSLRPLIRVRSDSISALTIALKMKTKGVAPGIIAREMALDIADACYQPSVAEHVPGDHNVIPDMLSRKFQPGAKYVVPPLLLEVPETHLPLRGREFYRSLAVPPTA